ncbi:MAG: hypothetical protein JWN94_1026 [Betaproteobacteria bacterium]|nr:hypothetical protein [Betaproteobacteria bacterium]
MTDDAALTENAYQRLIANLQHYGNKLSDEHKTAMRELVWHYSMLATGHATGRLAFPLATGLGKTQSIVAWCAALHELNAEHVSVAVAASKVEALCDLKRDLIRNGVPESKIGLLHSLKDKASMPSTLANDDRQIMLVTHARIKGGNLEQFAKYRGERRNLLIWDESLLVSDARAISKLDLESGLGWIAPRIGKDAEAISYLQTALDTLEAELTAQRSGKAPSAVSLAPLTWEKADEFKRQLGDAAPVQALKQFLNATQEQLRVVHAPQGGGLILYDITVPPELENIAILDASYPIRTLEQLDKSIRLAGKFSVNIKRYDNVTIHHLKNPSGRDSMTKDFKHRKREDRKVSSEVCELVSGLPADEAVILFTFLTKDNYSKPVDFQRILKEDLESCGIDLQATVKVRTWNEGRGLWVDESKPRFVFLTWGSESSLSKHAYCKHVAFAGVLHRSYLDLASYVAGQCDTLWADLSAKTIREVMISEIAHCLYQAMSRGSCRTIDGSQAHTMDAWLIHSDEYVRPLLEQAMPGVTWATWQGKHIVPKAKTNRVARLILAHLDSLPDSVTKLSAQRLKKDAALADVPGSSFTRSLDIALRGSAWLRGGRSLERKTFETYAG